MQSFTRDFYFSRFFPNGIFLLGSSQLANVGRTSFGIEKNKFCWTVFFKVDCWTFCHTNCVHCLCWRIVFEKMFKFIFAKWNIKVVTSIFGKFFILSTPLSHLLTRSSSCSFRKVRLVIAITSRTFSHIKYNIVVLAVDWTVDRFASSPAYLKIYLKINTF